VLRCGRQPILEMNDNYQRLEIMAGGVWLVDTSRMNVRDLLDSRPGQIIRCDGPPSECVTYIPGDQEPALGCVAGWISDE
jgi:hypothetical protein